VVLIIAWILLSLAVGTYAQNYRNRSRAEWTVLAILISPLIAFALVAATAPTAPLIELERRERRAQQRPLAIFLVGLLTLFFGLGFLGQMIGHY
jgi:hypothetical protein